MSGQELSAWLQTLEQRHHKAIDMGLERCRVVADRLQLTHFNVPVVTVAGTNGKGSTVATIVAMARAVGYQVGSYTSPHLMHFNERICLNAQPIADAALVAALEAIEVARGDVSLTYFEHTTLAALWWFQRQPLDMLVLEIGLGGRLDVVNLVDPTVAVITNIGLDHMDYLGHTIGEIALEKAGIMRAGIPVVLGERAPCQELRQCGELLAKPLLIQGRDFTWQSVDAHTWQFNNVTLPMPSVAPENASVALAACLALSDVSSLLFPQALWPNAMALIQLTGRLQPVTWPSKLRSGHDPKLYLDVGHNPHGAAFLTAQLQRLPKDGQCFALLAMLADKDSLAVMQTVRPQIDGWHLAGLDVPRGQQVSVLAAQAEQLQLPVLSCSNTVEEALTAARQQASEHDTIIAFGSFYTVAAIMALIEA